MARVGQHVGGKYRSAHWTGRITSLVKNKSGKVVKVKIRPDKASRHKGEPRLITRHTGKFHAV